MQSTLIPYSELLENVLDDSGYTTLTPLLEKINRWIFRAEQAIGYNGAVVFKKVNYVKDTVNWNGKRLFLPSDCLHYVDVYIGQSKVNNATIRQYGNFLNFNSDYPDQNKLELVYYGITHDAEGNLSIPRSHNEALVSYILWKIFAAKAFLDPNRNLRNLAKSYEQDWKDYRDACQGDEAWPQNAEDYEIFSAIRNFSTKDAMIYYPSGNYENDTIIESKEICVLKKEEQNIFVYAWQFGDPVTNIEFAPAVSQLYLDNEATKYGYLPFKEGVYVPYNKVGRIAFAIQDVTEKQYGIFDTFNSNITNLVFEHYYNSLLKLDIYISKEFYANSNIFFKIKEL